MEKNQSKRKFIPLNIAVLTISDTRTEDSDVAGKRLVEMLENCQHLLFEKKIVRDDIESIRLEASNWISNENVNVILKYINGSHFISIGFYSR